MKSNVRCASCGVRLVLAATGRPRFTCSPRCRQAFQRRRAALLVEAGPVAAASEASGVRSAYPVFSS